MPVKSELAPAKLNLTLELGDVRPDGYHEVVTYLVKLGWGDTVRLTARRVPTSAPASPADGPSATGRTHLTVRGEKVPRGRKNLVLQAAERFVAAQPALLAVQIDLRKRIPPGTGLGGGSSDAGTVLRMLCRLTRPVSERGESGRDPERGAGRDPADEPAADIPWAEALGADVPFFVSAASGAVGTGRGGELTSAPGLPAFWPVVLVLPPWRLSTARVYARAGRTRREAGFGERTARTLEVLRHAVEAASPGDRQAEGALDTLAYLTGSDLSQAAFSVRPELRAVWDHLVHILPCHRPIGMTGSGSAFYAILATSEEAAYMTRSLGKTGLASRVVHAL